MSGICGIVSAAGAPVDPQLLRELTASLGYCGPDAQDTWIKGCAGFGHALLRTNHDAAHERQPCSLDGETWITADARIDGQRDLQEKLASKGRGPLDHATDAELILHAYHAWGEHCLQHLIGDFAFAIWDGPRQRLFCARDHFGVKLFMYAQRGSRLAFANNLSCVRRFPAVSDRLDDLAIADFLLFESNQDPAGTAFAEIRRLPPAHCLTFSAAGLRTRSYWSLPSQVEITHRPAGEHVERFRELLRTAVKDRLRTDRVGVMMSGGLDSAAVAATAVAQMPAHAAGAVRAFTSVYDRLIPDEERRYAGLVAGHLAIPITYRPVDDYQLYERYAQLASYFPEPDNDAFAAIAVDAARDAAAHARVALTGWDGDALVSESPRRYFGALWRERRYARLLAGAIGYAAAERRLLPRAGWRAPAAQTRGDTAPFPDWLDPGLVQRLGLRERWREILAAPRMTHPLRPYAFHVLGYLMRRSNFFDGYDPGCTRLALEVRHPLLDLRLIDYCLSLPPFPWCLKKEVTRRAMRGRLPEAVRTRPKTPLAGFPYLALLAQQQSRWVDEMPFAPQTAAYFDITRIPKACGDGDPDHAWAHLRPRSLDLWLRSLTPYHVQHKEMRHEFA